MNPIRCGLVCLLPLLFLATLLGCRPQPAKPYEIETLSPPPACFFAFTLGEPSSDDRTFHILRLGEDSPNDPQVYSGPRDEILAFWGNGVLVEGDERVEWLDFDPATGQYSPNPGVDLTSWDMPVAVDPQNRVIYALAHAVLPSRKLEAHYLDGREPEHVNQFTADELDLLDPLPSNGWPAFYVDRPGQATAITPEKTPTRRLRVFGHRTLGGEFYDILGVFHLSDCIVIHREQEWSLMEPGGMMGVTGRTLSMGQIPGQPRPLERLDDIILAAADELVDDETVIGSSLFAYSIYTRAVDEIWDPASAGAGPAVNILSLAVSGPDDYLVVLGSLPDTDRLTIGRLHEGNWEPLVHVDLDRPATETFLLTLPEPEPEPEPEEAIEPSAVNTEGISPPP